LGSAPESSGHAAISHEAAVIPALTDAGLAAQGSYVDAGHSELPDRNRHVLATFDAPPYVYEIAILHGAPEEDLAHGIRALPDSDPFVLRLLRSGRAISELVLNQWSCGHTTIVPADRIRGADRQAKAWRTDGEHCDIGVAVQSVGLAGRPGLLVTQNLGFEYLYSNQYLFLAEDDQLRTLWNFDESNTSEDHTTVSVSSGPPSEQQDVVFVHVRRLTTGVASKVSGTRLHFDPTSREVVESPLPDDRLPLQLLVLGKFESAKAAQQKDLRCLRQLDLLQGKLFPALSTPRYFFGGLFASRAAAEAIAAEVASCVELGPPTILEHRARKAKAHGQP
jgi:hypothetical protein